MSPVERDGEGVSFLVCIFTHLILVVGRVRLIPAPFDIVGFFFGSRNCVL